VRISPCHRSWCRLLIEIIRLVPALAPVCYALPLGHQALPLTIEDVVVGLGGGAVACLDWVVPLELKLGREVASGGIVRTTIYRWGQRAVEM
jgi:hypothetical protein